MSFISRHRWLTGFGLVLAALVVAAVLFRWDWLLPIVNKQASAALGRPVTVTHLHVTLGRTTRIEAEGVTIDNPADWPGGGTFATADRLAIDLQPLDYLQRREITIPTIAIDAPKVDAQQLADGRANWTFGDSTPASPNPNPSPAPKIGALRITDGHAHVRDAKLRADFNVDIATRDAPTQPAATPKPGTAPAGPVDDTGQIVASAKGTYAAQPITAEFVGGALLTLQEASKPYPVDLKIANGPTRVTLTGTVKDPLAFKGVDLKLEFAGPDMSLLLPLTGIAIPKTPPYRIAGKLDYTEGVVDFNGFTGRVGSSDLAGSIKVDTKPERPVVDATLTSKLVDLKDLAGFIGGEPGDADKGTKKPVANPTGKVLPSDPISLPKLNVADVHLRYQATHIEGRRQPLDNMRANLDIVNGEVSLKPLSFSIGEGTMSAVIALAETQNEVHARADVDFRRLDVDKLLSATGIAHGAGTISGKAVLDGTGHSVAEILGHGNGELKLYMGAGGNLSALLVDLSGLEFGNAFLSAIGVPNRAQLQCLIADVVLQQGDATARTVLIDTDEARVGITGDVNLRTEGIKLAVKTESKHFSIGSLPTPIDVDGTLGRPAIAPEIGPLALRGGAAVALGVLGTPLAALLPTIQFGTGEDGACHGLLQTVQTAPRVTPVAPPHIAPHAAPIRLHPVRPVRPRQ
jgi:uncharacterized protein involved in outer membrane biogenesis